MNDWIDYASTTCTTLIREHKNCLMNNFILLGIIFSIVIYDCVKLYQGEKNILVGFSLGMLVINAIFLMTWSFFIGRDLKDEKKRQRNLVEMRDDNLMKNLIKQLKNEKEFYERASAEIMEKNNPKNDVIVDLAKHNKPNSTD